jgi:hypothetical protein
MELNRFIKQTLISFIFVSLFVIFSQNAWAKRTIYVLNTGGYIGAKMGSYKAIPTYGVLYEFAPFQVNPVMPQLKPPKIWWLGFSGHIDRAVVSETEKELSISLGLTFHFIKSRYGFKAGLEGGASSMSSFSGSTPTYGSGRLYITYELSFIGYLYVAPLLAVDASSGRVAGLFALTLGVKN